MERVQDIARGAVRQTQRERQRQPQQQNPAYKGFFIPPPVSDYYHDWQFKPISMEAYAWQMMGKEADITQHKQQQEIQQKPDIKPQHLYGWEQEFYQPYHEQDYDSNSDMDI